VTGSGEQIDDALRAWIEDQPVFFVGSAALDAGGEVNVSPKGPVGGLRILDGTTVAYLDVVGSAAETLAHLQENGRIVVMLCSFDEPGRVLRLYGRGRVVGPEEDGFGELLQRARFDEPADPDARRAVVVVDVARVAETPGQGVPLMSYLRDRTPPKEWTAY
jgi:hypothetical protein